MDENPYQAPKAESEWPRRKPVTLDTLIGLVGLFFTIAVLATLIGLMLFHFEAAPKRLLPPQPRKELSGSESLAGQGDKRE